jgi:D-glycero-D-manno-heptose 1,7-bisphosphate phosphatase
VNKALFVDRDGVINVEKNYLHRQEDFEFIDGVFDALRHFQDNGFLLVVITNQSGIGRGYYGEDDFQKLTAWMIEEFARNGVKIAKVYHCPHTENEVCECRKPSPGMILAAKEEFDIDLASSWLIGDKESDVEAGQNAAVGTLVIARSGHKIDENSTKADYVVDSIAQLPSLLDGSI